LKILLDTQIWLWMLSEPERLSRRTQDLVESSDNELYLSAASSWEIAIKYSLGRLRLPADPAELVPGWIAETQVTPLSIEHRHALAVAGLESHHRDPFDRILIAQARVERLPILTADHQFEAYEVEVLRA
jgi:PIN domain nuclease of toxin-antitoxin system